MSIRIGACAAFLSFAAVLPASAHAVLVPDAGVAGKPWQGALKIPHGCNGSPTTSVRISLPAGATGASAVAKPGWQVRSDGQDLVWSGGSLPAHQAGFFLFSVTWPAGKPGATLHTAVTQTCAAGSFVWSQIPAAGQDPESMKTPAAHLTLVAPDKAPGTIKAGSLLILQPWARATPKGAPVGGGYFTVLDFGSAPDRLTGTSLAGAKHGEVHEMSMDGTIMHMKQVDGVDVPAGGGLQLKPGGYHLMFMDLKTQLQLGTRVKGSLTFAKAGTVPVEFEVRAMNAGAEPMHMNMQGGMSKTH